MYFFNLKKKNFKYSLKIKYSLKNKIFYIYIYLKNL